MKLPTQVPKTLIFIAVGMALAPSAMARDRQTAIPSFVHAASHPVQLADRDDHHRAHFPIVVHPHPVDHRGAVWGHGDIHHFHDFDFDAWHRGEWRHDWHDNHFGWWWVVGGAWVFFNAPIYPYPDPYVPSTVVVQTAPAAPPADAPPAPAYWYYCSSAQNYYPYVTQCPMGWEQVPATPPAPVQATPPAPPPGSPPPPPPGDSGTW